MSEVECPWCGHEIKNLCDFEMRDGDTEQVECGSCDRTVEISCSVLIDYKATAIGCEKHEFDYLMRIRDNCFRVDCRVCKNEFYNWQFPNGEHPRLTEGSYVFVGEALLEAIARGFVEGAV